MAHHALSMQTVTLDEMDPAGVMNGQAARWWQQNVRRIPFAIIKLPMSGMDVGTTPPSSRAD